ncbi:2428_t:CDS:2 [Cetraspora pellucida]|uniref:2428_t:CDS:1 n=1 Tax=Cetraspora pellucida TaxID=1433469 RepID=A0A9N9EN13_9GLOM|nr:2428_t:CDS:2 [Cetraspora pellucida]
MASLTKLNTFLEEHSYIEGYEPTQADVTVFKDLDNEEAERLKAERLEAYHKKKAAKPKVIAKSMVCLDVKPWEDTTDLDEMEKLVRGVTLDGLVWGASKLIPIGYGIKKLQISCVVEDDKVGIGENFILKLSKFMQICILNSVYSYKDDLEEQITGFEDHVQSVDVVSFNKL